MSILQRAARTFYPYLWFLPALAVIGYVMFYPWIWSLWFSFRSWSLVLPDPPRFVGVENYVRTFADPLFRKAFVNSINLTFVSVAGEFFLGFSLALLLNRRGLRARKFFLSSFVVPMMLTPVMVSIMWRLLLASEGGLVNYLMRVMSLTPLQWMADPSLSMTTVCIVEIWQNTSFVTVILLAGLQSLPEEPYEAARVDGASGTQAFWYITLPGLRPLIAVVLLFRVMFALRAFDIIYALFGGGGPGNSAMVLGVYLYEHFRVSWQVGESAAISYILLAITILTTVMFLIKARRGESVSEG